MALLARVTSKNPADWTDRELLKWVLRSDARGWAELVRRYRPLIYRCITKVTLKYAPSLGSADLDEIYADVMMQLVREDMHKLRIYNPARGTKLGSWIGMISVNAAYDYLRSAGRRPLLDKVDGNLDPHEECDRTPLDQLIEKERWTHLNELLADFTEKDRMFVELYYQKGMEADEIAAEMQISLKTVYSKKHKIRAHLVRCLGQIAGDSPIADLALAS
ncbi:MAG TPA: sigma-70 family RNA polymerase sigma factor [Kofleriaceae bacterium]|nr:sigma-70 family RNA polymerase sigma factor [Kofleriaceae bacterium]